MSTQTTCAHRVAMCTAMRPTPQPKSRNAESLPPPRLSRSTPACARSARSKKATSSAPDAKNFSVRVAQLLLALVRVRGQHAQYGSRWPTLSSIASRWRCGVLAFFFCMALSMAIERILLRGPQNYLLTSLTPTAVLVGEIGRRMASVMGPLGVNLPLHSTSLTLV